MLEESLKLFLREDIPWEDVSSELLPKRWVRAIVVANSEGVLAGLGLCSKVFNLLGGAEVKALKGEGESFKRGEVIAQIEGEGKVILSGERVFLNLLSRMCSVAYTTKLFVERVKGTGVKILDTRKTTPGLRFFEKYAVRVGGGENHRYDLSQMILIKDNHKRIFGGIEQALRKVLRSKPYWAKVEVEVENLKEYEEVLKFKGIDVVMLDNFSPQEVKEAVSKKGEFLIEVSGGINLNNVRDYAIKGVDFISVGALTKNPIAVDLSLEILT